MRRNNGQGFSARQYESDKSKEGFPHRQFSNDGKSKEVFHATSSLMIVKVQMLVNLVVNFSRDWIAAGRPSTKSVGRVTTPQVSFLSCQRAEYDNLKKTATHYINKYIAGHWGCALSDIAWGNATYSCKW